MQSIQLPRAGALVTALALASLAACGEHNRDANPLSKADPSAVVIGTTPAEPSGDPPGTTPVADASKQLSNGSEQAAMPLPGQANDHSNVAPNPSQKSDSDAPKGQTQ
jgi:hypothetical protein